MQSLTFRVLARTSLTNGLRRIGMIAAMLGIFVAVSGSAAAAPDHGPKVYLLRGFMNVFSLGLDDLKTKLEKRGIRAEVYNHTSASRLADEIAQEYKSGKTRPVILVGHSWGGLAVVNLVETLGDRSVPVALAVVLDTTSVTVERGQVGTLLNLYQGTGVLKKGPGFRGKLINTDLAKTMQVGHFNIDKLDAVHNMILRQIVQAAGRPHRSAPAATAQAER